MIPHITCVSSMATRNLVAELAEAHGRGGAGVAVEAVAIGGVEAARRIRGGEVFDVVVLSRTAMAALAAEGLLDPASLADIARSEVAAAVPAGRPRPSLADDAALAAALRAAPRIGYSTGPSGDHLLRLVERLGLADALAGRLVQAPPGVPVAALLADGRADLGFQQRSELVGEPGIDLLGPLPPNLQVTTVFTAGVAAAAVSPEAARAFVAALVAPEAAAAKRRHGLEPA